MEYKGKYLTM